LWTLTIGPGVGDLPGLVDGLKTCLCPASKHAVAIIRGLAARTASGPAPDGFRTSWETPTQTPRTSPTPPSSSTPAHSHPPVHYIFKPADLPHFHAAADTFQLAEPNADIGSLLESFVGQELHKQIGWSQTKPALHYYRTAEGREVDYVLEDRRGMIAGVEVKAATNLRSDDLRGLANLADATGKRFIRGVVLYLGHDVVPFGVNLHALPLDALWRMAAE